MWTVAYQLLLRAARPWVRLRLRFRARREPAYGERTAERFGYVPAAVRPGGVWFHAVSAGEAIAAAPLIAEFAVAHPEVPVVVTTMTPAGAAAVEYHLAGRVQHCYAPYDFPDAVQRFYDAVRPRLAVLVETELWPNLVGEAAARRIPVLLMNARLSERSAAGYRRLGTLTRRMLGQLAFVACQYPAHRERFVALGVPPERVAAFGNVKFDVTLPPEHAARVAALGARYRFDDAPVWIAASTHPTEEALTLAAHQQIRRHLPAARLVLVPRHPPRAPDVLALCESAGFAAARHTRPDPADTSASVVLVDAMGVLLDYYALAAVAFVGGSFAPVGGHNPIEPAVCGVPVVMGPHVFNFADVVEPFRTAGTLSLVDDPDALAPAVLALLADPARRAAAGQLAREVVAAHAGATARLRRLLQDVFDRTERDAAGAPRAGPGNDKAGAIG
jgi:3-deoxy-D-manno-octulosonic-acid transferase